NCAPPIVNFLGAALAQRPSSQKAGAPSISRLARNRRRASSSDKPGNHSQIASNVAVVTIVGPGETRSSGKPVSAFSDHWTGSPKWSENHVWMRDGSPVSSSQGVWLDWLLKRARVTVFSRETAYST